MTEKLSERVERLEGPERALFMSAFYALNPEPEDGPWWRAAPMEYQIWERRYWRFRKLLEIGAWLSAAEMLVPEGCTWQLSVGRVSIAQVTDCTDGPTVPPPDFDATAATPAIALCAAALKSRGL